MLSYLNNRGFPRKILKIDNRVTHEGEGCALLRYAWKIRKNVGWMHQGRGANTGKHQSKCLKNIIQYVFKSTNGKKMSILTKNNSENKIKIVKNVQRMIDLKVK